MTDNPAIDARILKKMVEDALAKRGGGGDNTNMEARVAKLEALAESTNQRIGLIEQDLRSLSAKFDDKFDAMASKEEKQFITSWIGIIAVAIGLAGLMARGFHWI